MCHFAEVLSLRELSLIINSPLLRYAMRSAGRPRACWENDRTRGLTGRGMPIWGETYFVSYAPKRQRRRRELMEDLKTWDLFPVFSDLDVRVSGIKTGAVPLF